MAEKWFDQEFWEDNFGDFDDEDLQEILEEAVKDIADLLHGLQSINCEVIAKNAHKIVSACGNFGYLECAELAANIEQQAKAGNLDDSEKNLLIDMVQRVVAELGNKAT